MKHFSVGIFWRLLLLSIGVGLMIYCRLQSYSSLLLLTLFVVNCFLFFFLYRYVTSLNRKLTRFLESVRYSDFAVAFKADNKLGESFSELNQQFNEVLEAFRQARADKEANLHYLNTIVQHVGVGLISFDATGNVELVNQAALRLLGTYRLRQLSELNTLHPGLVEVMQTAKPGTPVVYHTQLEQELSVRRSTVSLRGRPVTVASIQNIRTELQQKELDAWQNLTKVLRHEIMNSITPIVSLVGTMQQIVNLELTDAPEESVTDLKEALTTIEHRGRGIMRFVEAYRSFTSIPQPRLAEVSVEQLLTHIVHLIQYDLQHRRILLLAPTAASHLKIFADAGQIEMVLINLVKNAAESLEGHEHPVIRLEAQSGEGRIIVRVADNGPGIEPEAMERIFIPFFTTKKTGSGIGLSLSRQIMQLHGGALKVSSTPGQGSTFSLIF
ncbi:sensor histidine kinase [Tellurirhabdus bombi]|uniref:sensor histidine kinase n=1 Tax=Tellurirhabdus bombi TaxID=2907205 RepID=UPI001F3B61C9|nr:ATP-binding protein [Tellurirhabdus bombi]